ncbi:MAG: acyl-CoA dehydrogenase family protein [Phycisphaerae bacterium]|nr:acyl-CoA dehydrogenase family protein [Phycisphaerae bacterium]
MANFLADNSDILFHLEHTDLARIADCLEDSYADAEKFDYAPANAAEAIEDYKRVLNVLGELAGDFIDPRAEDNDRTGNRIENNRVVRPVGMDEDLEALAQADLMGFTLPRKYGGLNFPNLIYTMATEIVSRADAALMNIFGLQGIAETINAFASDEIKDEYLPKFCEGQVTGAMVLTEPDAGSDLQAIKLKATQDENGQWLLNGVKRFITNGCGEVLLVLARSEPDRAGGLGLSLFICNFSDGVKLRRLEDKLGIHASPTCEMQFDDVPARLIGERQRGLVTYVMALMNGARIGIAAQSLGIAQAAYQAARAYAASRRQFEVAIEKLPAVADMLAKMNMDIQAARALAYESAFHVDLENSLLKKLEFGEEPQDKTLRKQMRQDARKLKRVNSLLTPMAKYICSEMCNRVAYDSIQVHGGSGFMRDYPVERYARDARITTIYEGTSQLQIVAAVRGVMSGTAQKRFDGFAQREYDGDLAPLAQKLAEVLPLFAQTTAFVKEQGTEYMDLHGRQIVDAATDIYMAYLLLNQARHSQEKLTVADRYILEVLPRVKYNCELITSGDRTSLDCFETLAGPVPTE